MSPDEWKRVQDLFHEALDRAASERDAFLDEACAGDDELRAQVQALLDADAGEARRLDDAAASRGGVGPGTEVGPYRLIDEIGQGGMGRVFLAERTDVGGSVALKLVRSSSAAPEVVDRFLVERRILAQLDHPHIARLFDAGVTPNDTPFFAMEYVEGETITAYCDRRRLPVDERLDLFATTARAVAYAHRNLVVHRDLKPSNVYVSASGEVKLLDFGIAKVLDADAPGLTQTGARPMTPGYAAPEQIRGEGITTATDVYALGVMLYEMLAGSRPHGDDTTAPHEVERLVLEEDARPPSTAIGADTAEARGTTEPRLRRTLRGDLDTIVMKALRREPERRYASAEQFVEDVRRYLDGRPVEARPDTLAYRARRFVGRHRWGVAASMAVLVALVVGLGAALWQAQVARTAQARAEAAARQAETELAKSEAVTGFLMDLFEAGSPTEARGMEVTARELLARGVERADTLRDQPAVQAELQEVIGSVYRELGEFDRAEPLLVQSVKQRRKLTGATAEVGRSLVSLGALRWEQARYADAEAAYREAYDVLRAVHGTDEHADVADALNGIAVTLSKQGRLGASAQIQRRLLNVSRTLDGPRSLSVAVSLNNLAVLLQNMGRFSDAEPMAREMLDVIHEHVDPPHPHVAIGLTNVGSILTDALRADEAVPYLEKALAMRRTLLDDNHPAIATSLHNLAEAVYRQGRYAAADSLFRDAARRYRATAGEAHAGLGDLLHDHGLLLHDWGRLDDARTTLAAALNIRETALGSDHIRTARTLTALAGLDLDSGRSGRAEERLRRALTIFEASFPDGHPFAGVIRSRLGTALVEQARYDEAEPLLRTAHVTLSAAEGVPAAETPHTTAALATLYDATGQPEFADRWR